MSSSLYVVLVLSLLCVGKSSCGVVTSSSTPPSSTTVTQAPSVSTSSSTASEPKSSSSSSVPSSEGPVEETTLVESEDGTESTSASPVVSAVTEIPEELTTIIEIEEPVEGSNSSEYDFVNLPGYGVIDDANTTLNKSIFSCFNRRYGYYADIAKNCYMFHLCYPVQEPTTGQILFQRFSFVCSDNAVFDQQHLVCVDNGTLSYPCHESNKYFIESNNKLIASMHQTQATGQASAYGNQQPGPIPVQNQPSSSSQPLSNSNQRTTQQLHQPQDAQTDPATLAAAEQAYREYARELAEAAASGNSTEEDTAAQYAILEQLFG